MTARVLLSTMLLALAGCGGNSPNAIDIEGIARDARARGPNGLEQRLTLSVDPADFREPGSHTLLVTSTVTNTSASPVSIASRVCLFFESDVEITAEAERFEPLISCGAVQQTTTLAPGASVEPMELRYRLRSGPGLYSIRVRHALDPEFRTQGWFRIP